MSRAAAIGDELRLAGYALAGAEVWHAVRAEDAERALAAAADVALLVLTPETRDMLATRLAERRDLVWVVVPS